jgi:glutamate-1-semialdehyde 2,1-aminomutase
MASGRRNLGTETNRQGLDEPTPPGRAKSKALYDRATSFLPDGVSRYTISRDPHPIYMSHGAGARLFDVDGNAYIDFNNNFTTMIHGHGYKPVVDALRDVVGDYLSLGDPTPHEISLAELLVERITHVDKVRFVNSGTEAVMHCIRAARGYTGRTKVAKLEGAYHGSYDCVTVSENSSPANWGSPSRPNSVAKSRATPQSVLDETVVLPFNDVEATRKILAACGHELSSVLLDVMPSRAGLIPITSEYASVIQDLSAKCGFLIISDEVLNLRLSYHGAAPCFGLEPHLTAMGKIIGGGLPIGAIGGKSTVMEVFAEKNGVCLTPQAGTFSANPLSMVAGYASMRTLTKDAFEKLEALGAHAREAITRVIRDKSLPLSVGGRASLFRLHPAPQLPRNYREAYPSAEQALTIRRIDSHFRSGGVILGSGGRLGVLSTAMTVDDIDEFAEVLGRFGA